MTQIIPVHSLNVVQLVKDLDPLRPSGRRRITADDAANSLIITGTQMSIHRFAEIIKALDSVNSSAATVRVYPLAIMRIQPSSLATLINDRCFRIRITQNGRGGGA